MKLTKYSPKSEGPKSSVKVTYNEIDGTTKLRFRKADGSVDGVKVYQPNDLMMMVDMHRWNKYKALPDSFNVSILPKTAYKTEMLEKLNHSLLLN
jgi:hypothetical protein